MQSLGQRILAVLLCSLFSQVVMADATASRPETVLIHHQLAVELKPQEHHIKVIDRITLPDHSPGAVTFQLHKGLQIHAQTPKVDVIDRSERNNSLYRTYEVRLPANTSAFTLEYAGKIHHALEGYGKEQARGFRDTTGLISAQGAYLAGITAWYPIFTHQDRLRFNLSVQLPRDWSAVSQGSRQPFDSSAENIIVWDSPQPQQEIYLIAAPFKEYNRKVGDTLAMIFLRQADAGLAEKYLNATDRYLQMYEQLIGKYPYQKFALVENFWETGFGMPSFTLLGSKVIRLPFIINSSYPHEILHNWWGNGVYVDYAKGNWSEGLTAYLADYLIKEQQGKAADYRQQSLQKYTDYAAKGRDFPLTQFTGRHSTASEAVGYGKTMMLFHMLRRRLGDAIFTQGLQQFYRQHQFQTAAFSDLRLAFEQVSNRSLKAYFKQWVERTGAPELRLGEVKVEKANGVYSLFLEFKQMQAGAAYSLEVPLAITLASDEKAFQTHLAMTEKLQRFKIELPAVPMRIDVDPEFDLFRVLAQAEAPPAFTRIFGSQQMLVVTPGQTDPELQAAYAAFAKELAKMGPDQVSFKSDSELDQLPDDQTVVLLGWKNRFIAKIKSALADYPVQFDQNVMAIDQIETPYADHSIAITARRADNNGPPISLITLNSPAAMAGLARKLPHYHKYSYLVFSGDEPVNQLKGRWSIRHSPMTVMLSGDVERGGLKKREALIAPPSIFDANSMMETIGYLSSDALKGRGYGEPGLDQAADYIAEQFRKAGLVPYANAEGRQLESVNESYFQIWWDHGGEPERRVRLKNVIGIIPAANPEMKKESVVIGAHYDHLGLGWPDVRENNQGQIHPGADDNASGVAVLLELAGQLGRSLKPDRTIVFAAFSGEEAGRKGSKYYVNNQQEFPVGQCIGMLNLDTVGRLGSNKLLVMGAGSASEWPHIFRGVSYLSGIPIAMAGEELDASDQVSFHQSGVPAVQLFSGVHLDYHRPTDIKEKIDPKGLVKVAAVSKEVIEYLASRKAPLTSNLSAGDRPSNKAEQQRRVSLGTIPDFTYQGAGYRLSGVVPGSPAEAGGLKKGDVIIEMAAQPIHGIKSVSEVLKSLQPNKKIKIIYRRQGNVISIITEAKPK